MTKEERVLCALSHEEPDRVPIYDLVDHRGVIEHYAGRVLTLENAAEVVPAALSHVLDTTRVSTQLITLAMRKSHSPD
jgi:hypothetical protein